MADYNYDGSTGYLLNQGYQPNPNTPPTIVDAFGIAAELGKTPIQFTEAVNQLYAYYQKTNQLGILKTKLENAFNTKIAKIGDASFRDLFNKALQQTTAANYFVGVNAPKGSVGKQITVLQWLDSAGIAAGSGSGAAPSPNKFIEITGREGAWRTFSEASKQLTGITPNKKDFEEYYKQLNAAEKKSFTKVTEKGLTRTTTGNPFDINEFTIDFIVKKIDFNNPKLGNAAIEAKQLVEQAFNDNGVTKFFSDKTKIKFIRGLLNKDISQEQLMNSVRQQSMLAYSAWAEDMKANPMASFADIISPYKEQYQNILEITGPVDITDVARLAVKDGVKLSAFDYQKALRNDERWAKTKQANGEAAELAKSFAQAFGVNI